MAARRRGVPAPPRLIRITATAASPPVTFPASPRSSAGRPQVANPANPCRRHEEPAAASRLMPIAMPLHVCLAMRCCCYRLLLLPMR
ncbi:hypothetical protein ZWY2020_003936 [Hordeum vulgare]|nr:hypothetical protein ZWY2020_003936 [Hordeum vulgare]